MYTQEIVCPRCGKMTSVNVPDAGRAKTPCKRAFCSAKIEVVVDEQGRVTAIKDGSCVVATACLEAVGHGDDCHELTILRQFRDSYLRQQPGGPTLIADYYSVAPVLVQQIRSHANEKEIWQDTYSRIRRCVALVESGEEEQAVASYMEVIVGLKERYLPPTE